ncbi:anti-sigma factor RsbA family regulatory protein [Actinomadura scrupuli]|uniref:anti-sigma factor RsbA family regulatory protein n=1 Tax=Actinomadura scrupuli TaxID=559629 RepID=UPI003D9615C4
MSRDERLVHQALLYGGEAEFLTATVPFLKAGLEADDEVLAVVPGPSSAALHDMLGSDAGPVRFIDAATFYQHPVRTIASYNDIVHAVAPRRVRVLAEPFLPGRSPLETVEWSRYEAVVNAAFSTTPAQVICGYDTRRAAPEVLDAARRTHPMLVGWHGTHRNRGYDDPERFGVDCDRMPLPAPAELPVTLSFERLEDLRGVRRFVESHARRLAMHGLEMAKFRQAVDSVVGNAIKHGSPPMELRLWGEDDFVVCEVVDFGHWRPDGLVGFLPPEPGTGFEGLWGARMLVDAVHVRTGWSGTVVRLRTRLQPEPPGH